MKVLFTADWHIVGESPICRAHPSDWLADQYASIMLVHKAAAACNADELWIGGDLFDQARCATEAVNSCLSALMKFSCPVRILCGNHDLLYHAYSNLDKSSIGIVLKSFKELQTIPGLVVAMPFGTEPQDIDKMLVDCSCQIWVTHQLTFPNENSRPAPGVGVLAQELLDRCPHARLILTGDYHHGFLYQASDGRCVVNPGCLNIQACDMVEYRPTAYLIDTDALSATPIDLGVCGSVDDSYKTKEHEKAQQMQMFASGLAGFKVQLLDFEANINQALPLLSPDVQQAVTKILTMHTKDRT